MKQRILLALMVLPFCGSPLIFSADPSEIEAVNSFLTTTTRSAEIFSTGFDAPEDAALPYPEGFRVASRDGRNGTTALFYERTDPDAYHLYSIPLKNLQPETYYTVSAWIRGENIKATGADDNIGVLAVEYLHEGRRVGAAFYETANIAADWVKIDIMFKTPAGDLQTNLTFHLRRKVIGKIWFDDVEVRQTTLPVAVVLTRPDRLSFFGDDGRFVFRVEKSVPDNSRFLVTITNGGTSREQLLKPDGLDIRGDTGKLEPGPVEITVKIADMDQKKIVGEETFHLEAYLETEPPKNAYTIDEFGRTIVDGKPFMPFGVYGFADEENYKRLKDAGFNCLQLYNSFELKGNVDHNDAVKNAREGLDLMDKYGLKLLFSLQSQYSESGRKQWGGAEGVSAVTEHAVNSLKDHPAMLAWYVSDEALRKDVPKIVAVRQLISRLDPWRPTWTLTYRYTDLPYYAISGDVIGVDPYPISAEKTTEEQSIKLVKTAMMAGRSTGLPVWVVPQIFNWNIYHNKDDAKAFAESHFPTLEEMRAMALYAAMLGAKGFVFYSNFDILPNNHFNQYYDKLLPGKGEQEWAKVVEMVKSVKELEPFVLSTKQPLEIAVESDPPEAVEAGALLDDAGNFRVIVIGTGGKAKGIFRLPESVAERKEEPLRSTFGKTKFLGNGRYEFTTDVVDSDVLK